MVAPGGFLAYENPLLPKERELINKALESIPVHTELTLEEDGFIPVNGTYGKGILGYIDTDKHIIGHGNTSITGSLAMAGDASTPILHDDKGSLAQPTYHGFWKQVTDSFEGFHAQDACSYAVLLYYFGYTGNTRSYKECNINS